MRHDSYGRGGMVWLEIENMLTGGDH
jgi:hypothetical protein